MVFRLELFSKFFWVDIPLSSALPEYVNIYHCTNQDIRKGGVTYCSFDYALYLIYYTIPLSKLEIELHNVSFRAFALFFLEKYLK